MQILGLDPLLVAVGISVIGVALRTWWGMIGKPRDELKPELIIQSLIIGLLVTTPIVGTAVSALPDDLDRMVQLIFIVTQIGAAIGLDKGAKAVITKTKEKLVSEKDEDLNSTAPAEVI